MTIGKSVLLVMKAFRLLRAPVLPVKFLPSAKNSIWSVWKSMAMQMDVQRPCVFAGALPFISSFSYYFGQYLTFQKELTFQSVQNDSSFPPENRNIRTFCLIQATYFQQSNLSKLKVKCLITFLSPGLHNGQSQHLV